MKGSVEDISYDICELVFFSFIYANNICHIFVGRMHRNGKLLELYAFIKNSVADPDLGSRIPNLYFDSLVTNFSVKSSIIL
jgi:hypothetical protein